MFTFFILRQPNATYYYYIKLILSKTVEGYNEKNPVPMKHLLKISSKSSWQFGNLYTVLVQL